MGGSVPSVTGRWMDVVEIVGERVVPLPSSSTALDVVVGTLAGVVIESVQ